MATTFTFADNQYGDFNEVGAAGSGLIITDPGDQLNTFTGVLSVTADEANDTDVPNNFALASPGDLFTLSFSGGGTITGLVTRSDNDVTAANEDLVVFQIVNADGSPITPVPSPSFIVLNVADALPPTQLVLTADQSPAPDTVLICFCPGTRIRTARGHLPVERIEVDDLVATQDHGLQPVRWVGRTEVRVDERTAPVRITAGALDNERDLLVSPQHRMLLTDWRAEVMFDANEVLVKAKDLVNGDTIYRDASSETVVYHHLLFDAHEIIFAEGAPTESLNPGKENLDGMADETREEILALFPELRERAELGVSPDARPSLKSHEAQALRGVA